MKKKMTNVKRFRIPDGDWVDAGTLVKVDSYRFDRISKAKEPWFGVILETVITYHDQKQGFADHATILGRPPGLSFKSWIVPTRWLKKIQ